MHQASATGKAVTQELTAMAKATELEFIAWTVLTCAKTCNCVLNWLATRTEANVAAVSDMLPVRVSVS